MTTRKTSRKRRTKATTSILRETPGTKPIFSIVQANFLPKAFAVWTRTAAGQPWKFHSAFTTRAGASNASRGLSYLYDTRITNEGYARTVVVR